MLPEDKRLELSKLLKTLEIFKQEILRLKQFEQAKLEGLRNANLRPRNENVPRDTETGH